MAIDFSLSAQLGYGSLPKAIREVKTESLFKKSLLCFFKSIYEDRDHFSI